MKSRVPILAATLMSILSTTITAAPATAEAGAESPAGRDARMQWWREARFGMFVHWGLYSGLAGSWDGKPLVGKSGMEWIQWHVGADADTYAKQAVPLFKPKPDFAREWARLAREAGCRYIVFTTKHHEGFALHDSKVGAFHAGKLLNRDLVREIVDACRAEGLRIGFYHSVIDWHHDQYDYTKSRQLPHPLLDKPAPGAKRDHARYIADLHRQVDELVSNYGQVDILWWDYSGEDFQGQEAWRADDLMKMVRARQPGIIMNNRLFRKPEAGFVSMQPHGISLQLDTRYGDFITPEQHIPATGMPGVDWETCMTMNRTWGYGAHDDEWKSDEILIRNLIDIASKGGNYLLNIGPTGNGSVPAPSVKSMQAIGRWMKANGESIHATTASPFEQTPWGRCTQKPLDGGITRLYLHVFDWPADARLLVPGLAGQPVGARLLVGGQALEVRKEGPEIVITLPAAAPDPIATVVCLDVSKNPDK